MAERGGTRRFKTILGAGTALLCLWAAGCSSGSGDAAEASGPATTAPTTDRAALADAFEKTVAVTSATVTFTMGGEINGEQAAQTSEGSFDFTTGSGVSTISGGGASARLVIDGDRTWLRYDSPEFDALLPDGATWIEAPTDELVERGVISVNPNVTWAPLSFLFGAENIEVDSTGRTFTFDVDVPAIRPALTADQRKAFDATLGGMADADLVIAATGSVTLDADGRIIAYRVELQLDDPSSAEEPKFVLDVTMGDFGLPVTVAPPAADQVANVADHPGLLDRLSGPGPGY